MVNSCLQIEVFAYVLTSTYNLFLVQQQKLLLGVLGAVEEAGTCAGRSCAALWGDDVGELSFGLEDGDGSDHCGDEDDSGEGVGLEVLYDFFDGGGEGVALDEDRGLALGGVMAGEELETAWEQCFDAGVLIDGRAVAGVKSRR